MSGGDTRKPAVPETSALPDKCDACGAPATNFAKDAFWNGPKYLGLGKEIKAGCVAHKVHTKDIGRAEAPQPGSPPVEQEESVKETKATFVKPDMKREILQRVPEHEVHLSFLHDWHAAAFEDWYNLHGHDVFVKWAVKEQENYGG